MSKLQITDYIISYFFLIIIDFIGMSILLKSRFNLMALDIGMTVKFNYYAVIAVYLLMLSGFFYFVDLNGKPIQAFIFGIVTHGIYELTNYSTIKGWRPEFVIIDTLWGGTLYTILFYFLKTFYN